MESVLVGEETIKFRKLKVRSGMRVRSFVLKCGRAQSPARPEPRRSRTSPGTFFLPAAELSGLRELFFRGRVFPFHHLSHVHSLFSATISGKFDFPEKMTSREM